MNTVNGTQTIGGIIGYNNGGNISYCVNNNKVYTYICYGGGIIGYNKGGNISYCTNYNEVEGEKYCIGGILGYHNGGNISYCNNYNKVESKSYHIGGVVGYLDATETIVTECENRGNVKTSEYMAGGIAGRNKTNVTIKNCKNYGEISADKSMNGGIVGYSLGGISYCANYGKINSSSVAANSSGIYPNSVGGIVGCLLNGEVKYVYNEGEVSIQNNSAIIDTAGGIVGELGAKTADSEPKPTVIYSYNKGIVKSDEYVGNIVGQELYENRVTYSYYISGLSGKGIGYIGSDIKNYEESLIDDETNVTETISDNFNYEEFISWIESGGN